MSTFNLDYEFDLYLSRVGLVKKNMDKTHLREAKRAFMAGAGAVLSMYGHLADMNEQDAVLVVNRVMDDVKGFWVRETTNSN